MSYTMFEKYKEINVKKDTLSSILAIYVDF